jgi:hypothetical protein
VVSTVRDSSLRVAARLPTTGLDSSPQQTPRSFGLGAVLVTRMRPAPSFQVILPGRGGVFGVVAEVTSRSHRLLSLPDAVLMSRAAGMVREKKGAGLAQLLEATREGLHVDSMPGPLSLIRPRRHPQTPAVHCPASQEQRDQQEDDFAGFHLSLSMPRQALDGKRKCSSAPARQDRAGARVGRAENG